jgi:predicted alpha-1,6-mannanase (GH76 family)
VEAHLNPRKHPSRLILLIMPVLLGLAAVVVTMAPGGPGAAAAPAGDVGQPTSPVVESSSPTASPAPPGPAAVAVWPSATPSRVAAARADAAMRAFDRAFYVVRDGSGFFRATTAPGARFVAFWRTAEMIEMVEDAAERSGDRTYARMVTELTRGVSRRFGGRWTGRGFNDDIMWMVLAFERAYRLTGDPRLRATARRNFDATFSRGWSGDLGGGLWWTTDRSEKNACINAPAAIAAVRLAESLHRASYLRKAKRLYAWVRDNLYDEETGAVYDHVAREGGHAVVDTTTYTYNQGTFAGAARLLSRATGKVSYQDDAREALGYASGHMSTDGVLPGEGDGGDGGGFKGILARYAGDYLRHDATRAYEGWIARNAELAWSHRDARGLMGQDWSRPTGSGKIHAFDASAAVVLLQQLRRP